MEKEKHLVIVIEDIDEFFHEFQLIPQHAPASTTYRSYAIRVDSTVIHETVSAIKTWASRLHAEKRHEVADRLYEIAHAINGE